MKKILTVFMILAALVFCTACGNRGHSAGNYTFNGVHCADFSGNTKDLTVLKWYENSPGIEVKTAEVGTVFFSEGTYILYEETCPICGK